jgi:hypothetical protein
VVIRMTTGAWRPPKLRRPNQATVRAVIALDCRRRSNHVHEQRRLPHFGQRKPRLEPLQGAGSFPILDGMLSVALRHRSGIMEMSSAVASRTHVEPTKKPRSRATEASWLMRRRNQSHALGSAAPRDCGTHRGEGQRPAAPRLVKLRRPLSGRTHSQEVLIKRRIFFDTRRSSPR